MLIGLTLLVVAICLVRFWQLTSNESWLRRKALEELSKPRARLDESFSWYALYQSLYDGSLVFIDHEKVKKLFNV